jgi:hypothetical protein
MPKLDLAQIITEEVKDMKGNVLSKEALGSLPPTLDMTDRVGMAGSIAAQSVLSAGGSIKDSLDAAVKARESAKLAIEEERKTAKPEKDEEFDLFLRYIQSIAKLHAGNYEELTPREMLEVAMLCPYAICSIDEWKTKMKILTGK